MNKLIVPSILAVTMLVAGMFAFMPVEKASTVHTTITSQLCTALFGVAACPAVETPVESNVAAGGATSANIDAQDRAMSWHLESTLAVADVILIPAVAGKDMSGRAVVSVITAGAAGTDCLLESTDGVTPIVDPTDAAVTTAQAAFNTAGAGTPVGFTSGEGIQVDVDAAVECTITLYFDSLEP